jgi:hypothetical protein
MVVKVDVLVKLAAMVLEAEAGLHRLLKLVQVQEFIL